MRTDRRGWWIGLGLAGVIVATGCSAGNSTMRTEAGVVRPTAPNGPGPTTTAPPADTTPPATTPRVTDTTVPRRPIADPVGLRPDVTDRVVVREPLYVDGVPQVTVTPSRAPAGTRVTVDGTGFTDEMWRTGGGTLWLSITGGQSSCYLMAEADHDLRVDDLGHLTGSFVVPDSGVCRFTAGDEMRTAGFDFHLAFQCTACLIGTFSVPPDAPPPDGEGVAPTGTYCGTLAFSHGEVESAELYADGLSCDDTGAVLVDSWSWAPVTGPQHVDVAGFSCDRVGQSSSPPRATYRCTSGAQSVWFISTGRS